MIGFRQQHNYPSAHGRSDLYVLCRLEPLTYEINACQEEIKQCEWIDLNILCSYEHNNLTNKVSKLMRYGKLHGFDKIDIQPVNMHSIFPGRTYNFFHRKADLDT